MENPENLHEEGEALLKAIKANQTEINARIGNRKEWAGPDAFYRFYHQSLKVYYLQQATEKIVALFNKIGKESGVPQAQPLNRWFLEIISQGTGKPIDFAANRAWTKHTRPILEAYFHAREMLRLMDKYGRTLSYAPNFLPPGWGAVLYLYNLR